MANAQAMTLRTDLNTKGKALIATLTRSFTNLKQNVLKHSIYAEKRFAKVRKKL